MNPRLLVPRRCLLPTLLLLALAPVPGSAATLTWTNTLGGNWNLAANWSPNAVPGAADTATITTAGTYSVTLNVNATVAALNLGGASGQQTLAITANALVVTTAAVGANGIIDHSGGGLEGQLTVQSGGVLNFLTGANKDVYRLTLNNAGTVNHVGGQLVGGSTPGTIITNTGLWDLQGDALLNDYYAGPGSRFVNTGTVRKSAGGLARIIGFDLTNTLSGVIQSAVGTLQLPNNYTNTAGTLRLTGGRIEAISLGFTGGTLDGSGSYGGSTFLGGTISPGLNGAGKLTFTAGLNLGANVTVALEAAGPAPETGHDQLAVTGTVGISNSVLQFSAPAAIPIGTKLMVITNDSTDAIVGTFSNRPEDALFDVNQQLFRTRYAQGSGNDMAIVRDDGGVRLTGIRLNPGGQFEFHGLGTNSVTYAIYASPNVPTNNWTFLGNSTADVSGNFYFTDPDAFQFPRRFYYSIDQ